MAIEEEVWRPWDADDEEYADRLTVREMLPDHLRPTVQSWLLSRLSNGGYGTTTTKLRGYIETSLHIVFPFPPGIVQAENLVGDIISRGDRFTVRVLDLLVASMEREGGPYNPIPTAVVELGQSLDLAASAVTVVGDGNAFRIGRRLPEGVERIASAAAQSAGEISGRHLSTAWAAVTSIAPDTSKAMTEAIRAVEAAAGRIVTPKDKRPQLGKMVGAIKDDTAWSMIFETRDDGRPDLRQVLIGMLETLAFAQRDRHSGGPPEVAAALGHVQLASTLVSWFSTGVVVRKALKVPPLDVQ